MNTHQIVSGFVLCFSLTACGGGEFSALDAGEGDGYGKGPTIPTTSETDASSPALARLRTEAGDPDAGRPASEPDAGRTADGGVLDAAASAADGSPSEDATPATSPEGSDDAGELDAAVSADAAPDCMTTDAGCCQGIGPNWGAAWVGCTHNGAAWCLQTDPLFCLSAGACACTATTPSCCTCAMHDVRTLCAP